jgi:Beta protein
MKLTYVPILRAKKGEFTALENLSDKAKIGLAPLLDLPKNSAAKSVDAHLLMLMKQIGKACHDQPVFLDTSVWNPSIRTVSGEYVLTAICSDLEKRGVKVYPVIGYDRLDDKEYCEAIRSIDLADERNFCIRFDHDALRDIADPAYFQERLEQIVQLTGTSARDWIALADLSDLTRETLNKSSHPMSNVVIA